MDEAFNPKKHLLDLLGPSPSHPWAALIPQVLVWSFRRFCIEKLTLSEGGLEESLCDDLLELVHMYCAKGLEVVSMDWFTPENIEEVSSPLEEYMRFFIEFCKQLDTSLEENDDKTQDVLSEFLDESMGDIIAKWLGTMHSNLLIFPMDPKDDDEFTEAQFTRLINSLLMYSYKTPPHQAALKKGYFQELIPMPLPEYPPLKLPPLPVLYLPPPVPPSLPPPSSSSSSSSPQKSSLLWYVLAKSKFNEELKKAAMIAVSAEEVSELPPKEQPVNTAAKALARRRTLSKSGRRSQAPRVKTRKTHPASY